jgi:uncharacterized membrane-anchored protein YitT (DUF2179 family)
MRIGSATIKHVILILLGAIIAAIGLQFFLIPNHLLDGGVVGVSIIASKLLDLPLGIFLVALNIPFIYLGFKKLGKTFAIYSTLGILTLALLTGIVQASHIATTVPILAAVFGGVLVGFGVGLVIRHGGTLDGSDTIAILIDRKTSFSIGEVIMFMNIIILTSSGFVFGWNEAMYSLIAYYIAHKVIDLTVEGLDESKSVWIVSKKYKAIGDAIFETTGRKVTYVNGQNDEDIVSDGIIFSVITRLEERKLKAVIHKHDPKAFVVISHAHEIIGQHFKS